MSLLHVLVLPLAMALSWGLTARQAAGTRSFAGLLVLLGGVLLVSGGDRLLDPGPVLAQLWRCHPWQREPRSPVCSRNSYRGPSRSLRARV